MKGPGFWAEAGLHKPVMEWADTRSAPTDKLQKLQGIIRSYEKVLVAFSGGCDSAFVLNVAREVLGRQNVLAVIAKSPSLPEAELTEAGEISREVDVELFVIETHELENPAYASNPVTRCYSCKSELYSQLLPIAQAHEISFILNGTNCDDLGDWRPGLRAAQEQGVRSPLVEAGFRKDEIRSASKAMGLSTWSKPQAACLASRIPFGTRVTPGRLKQVEQGEEILKSLGFEMVRVRWFEKTASVEVGPDETENFFQEPKIREKALKDLKAIGFETVSLQLSGYRSGRFNPKP